MDVIKLIESIDLKNYNIDIDIYSSDIFINEVDAPDDDEINKEVAEWYI